MPCRDGNAQKLWILYGAVLTLNSLNVDYCMTAAEIHWIVKGTTELNPSRYFGDVLTLKQNLENVLPWGIQYAFPPQGNESLCNPSRIIGVRFDWEDLRKIWITNIKK